MKIGRQGAEKGRTAMIPTIRNGLEAASHNLSVVSHNIANAGSNGFKKSRANFYDTYGVGLGSLPGIDLGQGARTDGPRRQHSQGALKPTANELDLAVSGLGMFVTTNPDDANPVVFTRDGSMRLEDDGRVVSWDGRSLIDSEGQPIFIPIQRLNVDGQRQLLTAVNISQGGVIEAVYGTEVANKSAAPSEIVEIGTIALVRFSNVAGLKSIGSGQFVTTEKSGLPAFGTAGTENFGDIQSGNLEMSNINMTDELTKMMQAQQAYSASSRLLQAAVDMSKRLIS
jgi:flagellar hook protein FlgE